MRETPRRPASPLESDLRERHCDRLVFVQFKDGGDSAGRTELRRAVERSDPALRHSCGLRMRRMASGADD